MADWIKKQTSLQKFMGRMQDHLSAGKVIATNVDSRSSQIKLAILRATGHEDEILEDEAVRAVVNLGSGSRMRASHCVDGILKRLHKTHSWVVALKCLILLNMCLVEGGFMFQDQISFLIQKSRVENNSRSSTGERRRSFCIGEQEDDASGSGHSSLESHGGLGRTFYNGNRDENQGSSGMKYYNGKQDANSGCSGMNYYQGNSEANLGSSGIYHGRNNDGNNGNNGRIYDSYNGMNNENNGRYNGRNDERKCADHGSSSSKWLDLSDFFDPNNQFVSTWVKWYARFIQQWIHTSKALGMFFDSSMDDVNALSEKILQLPNPQLVKGISTLHDLLQEASHAEELVVNHCLVSQSLQLAVATASKAYELIKLCLMEFCRRTDTITQAQASTVLKICETISAKTMLFLHLFQLCQISRNGMDGRQVVFQDYELLQLQEDLKRVVEGNVSLSQETG